MDHNAAVFLRTTLLSDENRSWMQQMGYIGRKERALTETLAEKSKVFDDLAARFEASRTSHNVGETRIRDELSMIKSENMQLRAQMERANGEVTRLSRMLKYRESIISFQKAKIVELDWSASSGELGRDPNYSLKAELDHTMAALR